MIFSINYNLKHEDIIGSSRYFSYLKWTDMSLPWRDLTVKGYYSALFVISNLVKLWTFLLVVFIVRPVLTQWFGTIRETSWMRVFLWKRSSMFRNAFSFLIWMSHLDLLYVLSDFSAHWFLDDLCIKHEGNYSWEGCRENRSNYI